MQTLSFFRRSSDDIMMGMIGKRIYHLIHLWQREIREEGRKLAYFDEGEIAYLKGEVLREIRGLKEEKVVDLLRLRRLYIRLVAIEFLRGRRRDDGL